MRYYILKSNERLLISQRSGDYELRGPSKVWVHPRQVVEGWFYLSPQSYTLTLEGLRTEQNIPLEVTLHLAYQVQLDLLSPDLYPDLLELQRSGWQDALTWRTEALIRSLLRYYSWKELESGRIKRRILRQLRALLNTKIVSLGIEVLEIDMIRINIPSGLQNRYLKNEQELIAAEGRAKVLHSYAQTFGTDLPNMMTTVMQWEIFSTLKDQGKINLILQSDFLRPTAS